MLVCILYILFILSYLNILCPFEYSCLVLFSIYVIDLVCHQSPKQIRRSYITGNKSVFYSDCADKVMYVSEYFDNSNFKKTNWFVSFTKLFSILQHWKNINTRKPLYCNVTITRAFGPWTHPQQLSTEAVKWSERAAPEDLDQDCVSPSASSPGLTPSSSAEQTSLAMFISNEVSPGSRGVCCFHRICARADTQRQLTLHKTTQVVISIPVDEAAVVRSPCCLFSSTFTCAL